MRYLLITLCFTLLAAEAHAAENHCSWPEWLAFKQHYIEDGRVLDRSSEQPITTSEGQAYGLFFALLADDQKSFDQLLAWTIDNLAAGDLGSQLPAWLWGVNENGKSGVLDSNAASDADLWIAYTLSEAGRLWNSHYYASLSYLLARQIIQKETAIIPTIGRVLLRAPLGFVSVGTSKSEKVYRLNPSYSPLQLLDRLATVFPSQHWDELSKSSALIIEKASPKGFVPDWVLVSESGVRADAKTSGKGSYDAIRNYLWLGMLADKHPHKAPLLNTVKPMLEKTAEQNTPPETADSRSGQTFGSGPVGFLAAVLPALQSSVEQQSKTPELLSQVANAKAKIAPGQRYYDSVLSLFGIGWMEKRYRFALNGQLLPVWEADTCK